MKKIFVLFSSLVIYTTVVSAGASDSLKVKKALIIGFEVTGPVIGIIDNENINFEGYLSYRLNHKYYLVGELGYAEFRYSQYNYRYSNGGGYLRVGTDINLLKPNPNIGNHYVGIGFRYGLSIFNQETPWLKYDNYWGSSESNISPQTIAGHYIQISGGIKAELFKNIIIGWTIRMNLLLYQSGGANNKPVNIPGMGGTDRGIQPGIAFHLAWRIPLEKD